MGCINTKVEPLLPVVRIRNKKERKMLKRTLKKQGICAKVTKGGVAFDVPVANDFRKPKLPPINMKSLSGAKRRSSRNRIERERKLSAVYKSQIFLDNMRHRLLFNTIQMYVPMVSFYHMHSSFYPLLFFNQCIYVCKLQKILKKKSRTNKSKQSRGEWKDRRQ